MKIELDDLINTMTPEQVILTSWFYGQFDYGGGVANRRILNVEPFAFSGAIAGSEFLTYAATKLYLCFEFNVMSPTVSSVANTFNVALHDQNNTISGYVGNNPVYYTGAVVNNGCVSPWAVSNLYFSRIDPTGSGYTYMKFIGYRITLGT